MYQGSAPTIVYFFNYIDIGLQSIQLTLVLFYLVNKSTWYIKIALAFSDAQTYLGMFPFSV